MDTINNTSATGTDTFNFNNNVTFNGTINGNATNTDIFDYSAYTSLNAITVTVNGANDGQVVNGAATTIFTNINVILGGAGDDEL